VFQCFTNNDIVFEFLDSLYVLGVFCMFPLGVKQLEPIVDYLEPIMDPTQDEKLVFKIICNPSVSASQKQPLPLDVHRGPICNPSVSTSQKQLLPLDVHRGP
jgi:hypothetical protein